MPRAACLIACLTLTACNLPREPDVRWGKDGATQQDLDRATYECERDARAVTPTFGRGPDAADNASAFFQRCMRSQGWRLEYRYE